MFMDQQRSHQPTDIKEEEDDEVDDNLMINRTQEFAKGKDDSIGGENTEGRRKKPSTSTNATTAQRGQYTSSDVNNG